MIPTPIPLTPHTAPHIVLWMGDSGLTAPIAAFVALALVLGKTTRRLGLFYSATFVCAASIVFATKLGLFGWGDGFDAFSFRGPSGHATLSACVWPVVAWLLASRGGQAVKGVAFAVGFGLALAVAYVLVVYGYHTLSETVAGTLLGVSVSCLLLRSSRLVIPPSAGMVTLAAVAIAAWFGLQHGRPLEPMENFKYAIHAWVERGR